MWWPVRLLPTGLGPAGDALSRSRQTTRSIAVSPGRAKECRRNTREGASLRRPVGAEQRHQQTASGLQAALGETSEKADQWAFCASLYESLGGVRPFPVEDEAASIADAAEIPPTTQQVRLIPPIMCQTAMSCAVS